MAVHVSSDYCNISPEFQFKKGRKKKQQDRCTDGNEELIIALATIQ